MSQTTFDSLDFYEKLVSAGIAEGQAKVFTECMKMQKAEAAQALRDFAEKQEKRAREELATKTDLALLEVRLIKWMLGLVASAAVALFGSLGAMLAKGFGWW